MLAGAAVASAAAAWAYNITGTVTDNSGEPLPDATVRLLQARDSAFVKGAIADINGNLVSTQQVNGTSVTIDTTELTHGVYKAWAHHPSAMGRKSKSNEVEFTVI